MPSLDRNAQFKLANRPVGAPQASNWTFAETSVGVPADGEVLVQAKYISIDPAMRAWISDRKSYLPPVGIGEVMRALGIGQVVESRHPGFAAGDHVSGMLGVQQYALLPGKALNKVDPSLAPLPRYLGALGVSGLTAYFGLLDVGKLQPGQTVVVSGAAGAVGSLAGQIAKIKGCRVVGIAGGADKCRYLVEEIGFDAAIDYKREDVSAALAAQCPNGIDLFFDNVGGTILEAAMANLARGARIVISGAISQYNNTEPARGPANYMQLLMQRATMTGFVISDYFPRSMEAIRELAGWMAQGQLKAREDVVEGIEKFPDALMMLFTGENNGKLVLKV